jgi:uncharacterized protein
VYRLAYNGDIAEGHDCIEFNDRFRYIDVASDVAFLAMDFDHYQRPDLSWEIATRSAAALRDSEILRLMDFYKCYRAYVRGKVESLHQAKPEAPETEQKKSRMQAKSYFRLALRYAVCGSKPTVLTIMGRIASGKSTLANALRDELGCEVISSDRVRKELAGLPLYQRGNESSRRRLYSEAMTNKTYKALFQYAGERLDRHENLILDATFSRNKHRNELIRLLHSKGAAYRFIEAQAPDQVIKRRLQHRNGASNEISARNPFDPAASSSRWPRNSSDAFTAVRDTGGLGAPSTRYPVWQPSFFLACLCRGFVRHT